MSNHLWLPIIAAGLAGYGGYCLLDAPAVRKVADGLPRMTCDELIRNGPGGHRYLVLTDTALSVGKSVSERDSDTGALELYHPAYPAAVAREPAAFEFRLILGIQDENDRRRVRDDRHHRREAGQADLSPLTVEVTDTADRLPAWARDGLTLEYPGIPLGQCRVVTIGRDEPTVARAEELQWRGLGLLSIGGAAIFGWAIWRMRFAHTRNRRTEPEPSAV
ncbi:MAG TPA: hypothetical protein VKE40_01935 [Gemmataceae bacterium]|nr:hypothetical protein [Gemmataceae bacterium]